MLSYIADLKMGSSEDSVKVAVRVRPLVPSETARGCQTVVSKSPNIPQVLVKGGAKISDMFTFDHVFTPENSQEIFYQNAVQPIVQKLFKGLKRLYFKLYYIFHCIN